MPNTRAFSEEKPLISATDTTPWHHASHYTYQTAKSIRWVIGAVIYVAFLHQIASHLVGSNKRALSEEKLLISVAGTAPLLDASPYTHGKVNGQQHAIGSSFVLYFCTELRDKLLMVLLLSVGRKKQKVSCQAKCKAQL